MPPGDAPLPLDALRDLIALCRVLYVTFKGLGKGYDEQLTVVTQAGTKLRRALKEAERGGPDTGQHGRAWTMAEEATQQLGQLVEFLPAKALITASRQRLMKSR